LFARGYIPDLEDASDVFDDSNGGATLVFYDGTVAVLDETASSPVVNSIQVVGTKEIVRGQGSGTSSIYSASFEWRYWTEGTAITSRRHFSNLSNSSVGDVSQTTAGFTADAGMYAAQRMFDRVSSHLAALLDGTASNESPSRIGAEVVETLRAMFISNDTGCHVALPLSNRLRSTEIRSQ
jgi:hypothetical protein